MANRVDRRREDGSALLVAVLLLVFLGALGLSAMETVSRDRQAAGYSKRSRIAFFAAEAGAHQGLDALRQNSNRFNPPTLPATNLGTAADYPYGNRPSFAGDPASSVCTPQAEICWVRAGPPPKGWGLGTGVGGWRMSFWNINARGNGIAGGVSRVEVSKRITECSGYCN
jgi:Tfp pilus assembly protein PilX